MRIQHNIMAMNSYRNYNNNANALSSNLEKLSSGYKINRAGDDAAGLAISEKMRAQISGLDQAYNNVKDGVSLVKTAEGALQEVQDMLNRMVTLATQSANGTYEDDVDREALQDELDQLRSEINRISESANFNGRKLLDGSLGSVADITMTNGTTEAGTPTNTNLTVSNAGVTVGTTDLTTFTFTHGDTIEDGTTTYIYDDGVSAGTAGAEGWVTGTDAAVTIGAALTALGANDTGVVTTAGTDTYTAAETVIDFADKTGEDMIGKSITLGETVYNFVEAGTDAANETNAIAINAADDAAAIATALAAAAGTATGLDGTSYNGTATDSTVTYASDTDALYNALSVVGGGLQLQIGDTSDSYNQLVVNVQSMDTASIGLEDDTGALTTSIADISVETLDAATDAIDVIKGAINMVSAQRGQLGAIQNRLEHTMNNLSVMTENITDAESTIRDTDIADEMTAYTKNNILLQSAQAMLAQANQVPQGVLQLLQ